MSEQAQPETQKPWAPGNWHAALDAMKGKLCDHPFWRRVRGTPLENDIPVRAAQLGMEWLSVMAADRDAALDERDRLRADHTHAWDRVDRGDARCREMEAEIERLRAALMTIEQHDWPEGDDFPQDVARRALEHGR